MLIYCKYRQQQTCRQLRRRTISSHLTLSQNLKKSLSQAPGKDKNTKEEVKRPEMKAVKLHTAARKMLKQMKMIEMKMKTR